jgi:hypothetical protein
MLIFSHVLLFSTTTTTKMLDNQVESEQKKCHSETAYTIVILIYSI